MAAPHSVGGAGDQSITSVGWAREEVAATELDAFRRPLCPVAGHGRVYGDDEARFPKFGRAADFAKPVSGPCPATGLANKGRVQFCTRCRLGPSCDAAATEHVLEAPLDRVVADAR